MPELEKRNINVVMKLMVSEESYFFVKVKRRNERNLAMDQNCNQESIKYDAVLISKGFFK